MSNLKFQFGVSHTYPIANSLTDQAQKYYYYIIIVSFGHICSRDFSCCCCCCEPEKSKFKNNLEQQCSPFSPYIGIMSGFWPRRDEGFTDFKPKPKRVYYPDSTTNVAINVYWYPDWPRSVTKDDQLSSRTG